MKSKGMIKKGIAWFLTATMMVGFVPAVAEPMQAQAATDTDTTKTIAGLGTSVMAKPSKALDFLEWRGSYVYYGKYGPINGTAEPVKYRVLDVSTTDYSKDGKTQTMLLDCDSILYNALCEDKSWSLSSIRKGLVGDRFYNKPNVFTDIEKNAIANSYISSHKLEIDSDGDGDVDDDDFVTERYQYSEGLNGDKIFLLDVEDVCNKDYGYSTMSKSDQKYVNRAKTDKDDNEGMWWFRTPDRINNALGVVSESGRIMPGNPIERDVIGVSPAFNLDLSSVLFSSVVEGPARLPETSYKLTLLDSDMSIAPEEGVTRSGNTITVPYTISGDNNENATQVSVLITDEKYTVGNTNEAIVLDYKKLNVEKFGTTGTGTFSLPEDLVSKQCGTDYHVYILAEDVNGEKETDYASAPVEIHLWEAPTEKQINFGTQGIIDPAIPNSKDDIWTGSYVYYGKYNADGNKKAEPVKYRVLDASTTDYSKDKKTQTMLLDCDSILYKQKFDEDNQPNDHYDVNKWAGSDVKKSLNGDDFLNKEGVFTDTEKSAIAESTIASHELRIDSDGDGDVDDNDSTTKLFVYYGELYGEKIFLLDAEDVSNNAYGYSTTNGSCVNRKKTHSSDASPIQYYWLRSARNSSNYEVGIVESVSGGYIHYNAASFTDYGVSPALNLDLSSVLFSSASGTDKSASLTSDSKEIGTTTGTEWKLTLKDARKAVALTEGRNVTKASNGTITVPYTYKDEATTDAEKVNQISVMITDKEYGSEKAQILYYGALQNVTKEDEVMTTTGTGTFALPSGLEGTLGTDYHIYLLAEHVNADNATDYASEPMEVTAILNAVVVDTVVLPSVVTPIAEQALATEINVSSTGVSEKALLTWKKGDTEVTDNAEWATTYQAFVTLTAEDGYEFTDTTTATLNETTVEDITLNDDGTLTVALGTFTTENKPTNPGTPGTNPGTPETDECNHEESDILYTGDGEKEPTCTEAGIGHTVCTKCNKVMQSNVEVEAVGHTGGTATCSQKAVCDTCKNEYGEKNTSNHTAENEVRNAKEATCAEDGYTGDGYCKDCGTKTVDGTKIDKLAEHTWDAGVVTKEATTAEKGVKTYTCSVCKTIKTEEIPVKSDSKAPETKPETPETKPETPETKPETPETKPETPETKPETPETKPETPETKPETPETKPETPETKPETPETKPETPETKPETPETKPETPETKPETPETKPETPETKPETPGTNHDNKASQQQVLPVGTKVTDGEKKS